MFTYLELMLLHDKFSNFRLEYTRVAKRRNISGNLQNPDFGPDLQSGQDDSCPNCQSQSADFEKLELADFIDSCAVYNGHRLRFFFSFRLLFLSIVGYHQTSLIF